jgi:dihydrofolate reductase
MRKLVVAEFVSLDGVAHAPETWHFPYLNDQMFAAMGESAGDCDTMLLGRVTYESYAGAFADTAPGDPVGEMMNRPRKVVASRTLTALSWRNSELLAGDAIEAVAALKDRPGGTILTTGSLAFVDELLAADLVDEFNLLVHPVVIGKGRRLFEDGGPAVALELVRSTSFSTGVVHQIYRVIRP